MTEKIKLKIEGDSKTAEKSLDTVADKTDNASKSFAGAAAAVAGLVAAGALLKSSIGAAADYETQMLSLEAVIKATGGTAGLTAKEIDNMSRSLGEATLTSAEAARDASKILLTFRNVGREVFGETLSLAQDLAAAGFGSLETNALSLGKALNDPVLGLSALSRQGVTFTQVQKDMVKEMVAAGDAAGAQRMILDELQQQVGGAGVAAGGGLNGAVDTLGERWTHAMEIFGQKSGLMAGATRIVTGLSRSLNDLIIKMTDLEDLAARDLDRRFVLLNTRLQTMIKRAPGATVEIEKLTAQLRLLAAEFSKKAETQEGGDPLTIAISAKKTEHQMIFDMEASHLNNLSALQRKAATEKATRDKFHSELSFNLASSTLTSLSALTLGESKKSFELSKAFNKAEVTMSTYVAAQNAYASASKFSPIAGIAAAAAATLAGLARFKQLAKQKFNGGAAPSSSGAVGFAPSVATPGAPEPIAPPVAQRPTIIMKFEGILDKSGLRILIDGLNEEHKDGYTLEIA